MKNLLRILFLITTATSTIYASSYKVDLEHSNVGFIVKYLKISKVYGNFTKYDINLNYDKNKNIIHYLDAVIKVNSVDTQHAKRDKHLKSEEFFDIKNFEYITFKMTKFENDGPSQGTIYGNLTIKGVTKPIRLDFEYNGHAKEKDNINKIGFSIKGNLLRTHFKLGDKFPDNMISDKVEIRIDLQAIQIK
ncbi:YceI family protein [Campylobacter sp. MOP7]|uniref:YceI family protein n=1 Tax=Campylobacter canis TaxID=3378588 RepID=UPI00387E5712